jgi:hypothetical protein
MGRYWQMVASTSAGRISKESRLVEHVHEGSIHARSACLAGHCIHAMDDNPCGLHMVAYEDAKRSSSIVEPTRNRAMEMLKRRQ